MPYRVTQGPSVEPVSVAEIKAYLNITTTTWDTTLGILGKMAREHIEKLTRRALVNETIEAYFAEWPDSLRFNLPVADASAIGSMTYWDEAGVQQTVLAANYLLSSKVTPQQVVLDEDFDAPDLYDREDAIVITFTAGYGSAASNVPESLRVAVMALAGKFKEYPVETIPGVSLAEVAGHVRSLVRQHRVYVTEP